jgi:hypothetical protein
MLLVFLKSSLWQWSSQPSLHLVAWVSHYVPGLLFLGANLFRSEQKPWDSDGFLSTRWWTDSWQVQDVVIILAASHVASGQGSIGSQTATKIQNVQQSFRPHKVLKLPGNVKLCNIHSGLTTFSNCHEKSKFATFIQAWQGSQIHSGLTRFSNCHEKSKCAKIIQASQGPQTATKSQNLQLSFRHDMVFKLPRKVKMCNNHSGLTRSSNCHEMSKCATIIQAS